MTSSARSEPTPWGTRRRLQALMNRGWSPQAIQAAAGVNATGITTAVNGKQQPSQVLDDHLVAAVYDWMWQRPPPSATDQDQRRAATARDTAERNGWPPPMAWDDEVIDHPDGQPAPGWKPARTTQRKAVDLAEDLAFIREHGGYRQACMGEAALRLGVTRDVLQQATLRAARYARRQAQPQAEPEAEAG